MIENTLLESVSAIHFHKSSNVGANSSFRAHFRLKEQQEGLPSKALGKLE